jgi:hypothetical protein
MYNQITFIRFKQIEKKNNRRKKLRREKSFASGEIKEKKED